jgi:hypothetical protein
VDRAGLLSGARRSRAAGPEGPAAAPRERLGYSPAVALLTLGATRLGLVPAGAVTAHVP